MRYDGNRGSDYGSRPSRGKENQSPNRSGGGRKKITPKQKKALEKTMDDLTKRSKASLKRAPLPGRANSTPIDSARKTRNAATPHFPRPAKGAPTSSSGRSSPSLTPTRPKGPTSPPPKSILKKTAPNSSTSKEKNVAFSGTEEQELEMELEREIYSSTPDEKKVHFSEREEVRTTTEEQELEMEIDRDMLKNDTELYKELDKIRDGIEKNLKDQSRIDKNSFHSVIKEAKNNIKTIWKDSPPGEVKKEITEAILDKNKNNQKLKNLGYKLKDIIPKKIRRLKKIYEKRNKLPGGTVDGEPKYIDLSTLPNEEIYPTSLKKGNFTLRQLIGEIVDEELWGQK
jgi:hypothetical protein